MLNDIKKIIDLIEERFNKGNIPKCKISEDDKYGRKIMKKAGNKLVTMLLLTLVVSFLFYGCGVDGERTANEIPEISITSYEGTDVSVDNAEYPDSLVVYSRQRVYWHAVDKDGTVVSYAYRILDENGDPISTPGNSVVDTENAIVPDDVKDLHGGGWVVHFKEGALQETSLADAPNESKTIWSDQKYVTLNLPSADADGNPLERITTLEVICMDNRGAISDIANKKYKAMSEKPTCLLKLAKGALNAPDPFNARELSSVGTGIVLDFSINDSDPFVEAEADYYMFKVLKRNASTQAIIETLPADSTWYSTKDHGNMEGISEFLLTKYTEPSISSDFENSLQVSYTEVVARSVDMAGIQSEDKIIRFAVREGYHAQTMIYPERTYAIGENHFTDYRYKELEEDPPIVEGRYATALFKNKDGFYACLGSSDLKLWLRWGYHGQYGYRNESTSEEVVTDNPYDSALNILLDEETDENYFSSVEYYDLRLDGAAYNYPPLAESTVTDESGDYAGETWLRVPADNDIAQSVVVTGLDYGYHKFEVRAVDLQGEADKTPAVLEFIVQEPIPTDQKDGVLIIDDDHPSDQQAFLSPEQFTDDFYNTAFENVATVDNLDLQDLENNMDYIGRRISPTDLNQYKLVVYHADSPGAPTALVAENDGLALYMMSGGNILFSGGANIDSAIRNSFTEEKTFFERIFGFTNSLEAPIDLYTASVTTNAAANPYFIGAQISSSYMQDTTVNLEVDEDIAFSTYVDRFAGIGPVTYFPIAEGTENSIAMYNCKSVYDDNRPPTPDEYEQYNLQTVAFKTNVTAGGQAYMFGFPLSYMESQIDTNDDEDIVELEFDTTKPVFQLIDTIYQSLMNDVPAE